MKLRKITKAVRPMCVSSTWMMRQENSKAESLGYIARFYLTYNNKVL